MLQGTIIRGTTPTHDFELPYPQDFVKDVRLTYGQNGKEIFSKVLKDCSFENGVLSVKLTQEDTFSFLPKGNVFIEMRVLLSDGGVIRNEDSIELRMMDSMNREVLS